LLTESVLGSAVFVNKSILLAKRYYRHKILSLSKKALLEGALEERQYFYLLMILRALKHFFLSNKSFKNKSSIQS